MKFLNKLFKRQRDSVEIKSTEIKEWLSKESDDILISINNDIKIAIEDFKNVKNNFEGKLKILQTSKVQADFSDREIHIMQGNRDNYLKNADSFIKEISIPEFDYELLSDYTELIEAKLQQFNESSSKGYYVLTNFFNKDMKDIASAIKDIEKYNLKLRSLLQNKKIREFKSMFFRIREINDMVKKTSKLEEEIFNFEKDIEFETKKHEKLKLKIEELKKSNYYKDFHYSEEKRKEIEAKISQVAFRLNNLLKSIDKVLRKYSHESLKKELILDYLNNPMFALEKDNKLEIIEILEKLSAKIKKGSIEVKEKQKTKTLSSISKITKSFLADSLKEYEKLKGEKAEINAKLEKNSVMMDYRELEYRIEHTKEKIDTLNEKLSNKKKMISSMDVLGKTKKLESMMAEFTGYHVKIIPDFS